MSVLSSFELVDNQIDVITKAITRFSSDDPELGAGLAAPSLSFTRTAIDRAAAVVGELDNHLRSLARHGKI